MDATSTTTLICRSWWNAWTTDGQIHEIDLITDTAAYPAFIAGDDAAQS